jgi:hypothetical protein
MRLPCLILIAIAATAAVGCGDDEGTTSSTASPAAPPATILPPRTTLPASTTPLTTAPATSTAATDTSGIDPLDGASTNPASVPPTPGEVALLRAVRVARNEGFDRVVFEFENTVPGYEVGYGTKPIAADPGETTVPIAGEQVLIVRMERAAGVDLSGADYRQTYTGPTQITADTPEVTDLARVGDFEAVLTWAIGLRDPVDFRVTTLSDPPRLVVDVRNVGTP